MRTSDFQNPAATYRPSAFWSWNDDFKDDELRRRVREMAAQGWGGFFMHSRDVAPLAVTDVVLATLARMHAPSGAKSL